MSKTPQITLANLAGGGLMETASAELHRICDNIQDPNVKADAKRKLKIEILLEPDETRQMVKVTYQVQASIPGPDAGKTVAIVAMDPESKGLALFEAFTQPPLFDEQPEQQAIPFQAARA